MLDKAPNWINEINWNQDGLIPVIIQDISSETVLMHAWMNKESLLCSVEKGLTVFWSRSRQRLWKKGESSGHIQHIKQIRLDCDADTLLIKVEQEGNIACHTGRKSCFYQQFDRDNWITVEPVIKNPDIIYDPEK